jgi:hypothetical protein
MIIDRSFVGILVSGLLVSIPAATFADEIRNADINAGRASVLLERASDGLSRLTQSGKVHLTDEWTEKLQNEAADICALVQKRLEKAHLDEAPPLCSVE